MSTCYWSGAVYLRCDLVTALGTISFFYIVQISVKIRVIFLILSIIITDQNYCILNKILFWIF